MADDIDIAIDKLHASGVLSGVALYAFGQTFATEQVRRRLALHGLALVGILDNNVAKQGGSLGGVPIIAPAEIRQVRGPSLVLIASRFHDEMRRQLLALGYTGKIMRVGELKITTKPSADQDLSSGLRHLEGLRRAHPDRHLVLCPFAALGDVYWALAYLPAYVAAHRLAPAIPVVVGDGCREVARLFGYTEVVSLEQEQMDDLVAAALSTQARDTTVAHHDRPYGENAPVRALDDRFIPYIDLYRDVVYGLSDRVHPRTPSASSSAPDGPGPLGPDLPRGRTVLMAAYAKSVLPVATSFWLEAAERCVAQGYAVASVVHGDEQPVPGTTPIALTIPQLAAAVECAGTFVALRSGLCDIVRTVPARKVHVMPDAYYSTTHYKVADFFALPGWESVVLSVS